MNFSEFDKLSNVNYIEEKQHDSNEKANDLIINNINLKFQENIIDVVSKSNSNVNSKSSSDNSSCTTNIDQLNKIKNILFKIKLDNNKVLNINIDKFSKLSSNSNSNLPLIKFDELKELLSPENYDSEKIMLLNGKIDTCISSLCLALKNYNKSKEIKLTKMIDIIV